LPDPRNISINDYTYELPVEKIALHPPEQRDASQLLVYKNGVISTDIYQNLHQYLPANSLLVFNDTKVIKARLLFTKPTGAVIEIFLLEPFQSDHITALSATRGCLWKCLIGGASKWKEGGLELKINNHHLSISLSQKLDDAYVVSCNWDGDIPFAELLEQAGQVPLPPYIKRKPEEEDSIRYQTIYASHDGSVAAPTAGLHFTERVFANLASKNITQEFVTLHVGAGTFKPVKAERMGLHEMHAEWISVHIESIRNIAANLHNIIAVGTTSLRTLESLYWLGVKAVLYPASKELSLGQWEVYEDPFMHCKVPVTEALRSLINWLETNGHVSLFTSTRILIAPGYHFKVANALVTNFHQPKSTLLLLVAAAVGDDWRKVYNYALENEFRFLSYGDGSLLWL
jgi:S-adenosylmethionine:tRNA ribosyltransferase-isomerase